MYQKRIASLAAAAALAVTLIGCGGKAVKLTATPTELGSGITISASDQGSEKTSTQLSVKAGDTIVVSPALDKGSIHLTVKPANGGAALFDDKVSGNVLFTVGAEPGDYLIEASGTDTAGSVYVAATNQEELMKQNEQLSQLMETASASANTTSSDSTTSSASAQ